MAFDSAQYLKDNPDVASGWSGTAEQHYNMYGKAEGRAAPQTGGGGSDSKSQQDLLAEIDKRIAGITPSGSKVDPALLSEQDLEGTMVPYTQLGDAPYVSSSVASTPVITGPEAPEEGAYSYEATTAADQVKNAQAAILERSEIAPEVTIDAPQGTLSEEAIAQAAQAQVQQEQLVSFQLGELYQSIEEGKPLPPWAAGPVRTASAIMQKRGLGASSMAAAAVSQAVLEAGLPIAAADAAEYSKINIANLNARQQAIITNANNMAAMDMANLDARMKAAITNAQSFLAIDLQNLTNEQATEALNYEGNLQALFTDTAADNAAKQFNAKSQQQVDEFFAELGVQVDNANANRIAAMSQFNVDQVNSIAQFNATMADSRERFDATMKVQIDQSNALWRREIATADTAAVNDAQRINALNVLETSQSALNALWQRYRDESAWLVQSSENALSRSHQLTLLEFEKTANIEMFDMQSKYETGASVGNAVFATVLGVV